MLSAARIGQLLEPFALNFAATQTDKVKIYLELLLRWNRKINLTGPCTPEECVTRHFGESLYLSRWLVLGGNLLDIGSGAGFPGLALKIVAQTLVVTLLEPVGKKRAFLKEVVRECGFWDVTVLGQRLEDFCAKPEGDPKADFATARAVGGLKTLTEGAGRCLKPGGRLCLWLGHEDGAKLGGLAPGFGWDPPVSIPLSQRRDIWIGRLKES